MKRFVLFTIFALVAGLCRAQISAGNDTTICSGSVTLHATYIQGTSLSFSDDQYSGVVNIGFPFTFFGNTYTQCLISSNNYITFDLTNAGGYSPWVISTGLPSSSNPVNSIMCPWQDLLPPSGGTIEYTTVGAAPNRVFIVSFCSVAMFSCTNLQFSSQIKLYEGSNIIETHITNKPLCTTWNSGYAIHGIQDATGSVAYVVPGRNYPTTWVTSSEGYQFVPTGPSTYTQGFIPFNPSAVVGSSSGTVSWYNGSTLVGTGPSITVSPAITTTYVATLGSFCGGPPLADTVVITVGLMNNTYSQTNVSCFGGNNGAAVASGAAAGGPYDYSWTDAAGNVIQTSSNIAGADSITGLTQGTYSVTITNTIGCTATHSFTITEPAAALTASLVMLNDSCSGAPDGKAVVTTAGGTGPYSYVWTTVPVQTADSAVGLPAGTYTVTVTDAHGCTQVLTTTIFKDPAPVADFTFSPAVLTLFDPLATFTDLSTNAVTWQWNFGDGDTSGIQHPTHTYEQEGTYPVTLIVTNAIGCTDSIVLPLRMEDFYTFYVPNSFTPNGDGKNDLFGAYATGIDLTTFQLRIFTRWGDEAYESSDIYAWWNGLYKNLGNPVQEGVYVYVATFKDLNKKEHKMMGHVTLMR